MGLDTFDDRNIDASFGNGAGPDIVLSGNDETYLKGRFGAGVEGAITESVNVYVDYDA